MASAADASTIFITFAMADMDPLVDEGSVLVSKEDESTRLTAGARGYKEVGCIRMNC